MGCYDHISLGFDGGVIAVADEVMDMEEDMEDTGGQDTSNSAYDYANLAAAMDDGDAVLDQGTNRL